MTGFHRDPISDWTRRKENPLPVASGGSHGVEYCISLRRLIEWRAAQRADATVEGEEVVIYVAGDAHGDVPMAALAAAGVLRRCDLVDVNGTPFRVGTPTIWPAADLRRYLLSPA